MTSLAPMYYPGNTLQGVMVSEPNIMDRTAVARLIDVDPLTVTRYLYASRPGGRYEQHPFPVPDVRLGGRPYWLIDRADEIKAWAAARPGRGSGATGRPRKAR